MRLSYIRRLCYQPDHHLNIKPSANLSSQTCNYKITMPEVLPCMRHVPRGECDPTVVTAIALTRITTDYGHGLVNTYEMRPLGPSSNWKTSSVEIKRPIASGQAQASLVVEPATYISSVRPSWLESGNSSGITYTLASSGLKATVCDHAGPTKYAFTYTGTVCPKSEAKEVKTKVYVRDSTQAVNDELTKSEWAGWRSTSDDKLTSPEKVKLFLDETSFKAGQMTIFTTGVAYFSPKPK